MKLERQLTQVGANNNGSSPRWWRYACAGLKLEWKSFHIFHRWNICVNHLYLLRVTQFSNIRQNDATNNDFHLKHFVIQGMSQEEKNMIFAISKVICILYVRFGTVLSHVVLQLLWLFAGVVALLAGKRFLALVTPERLLSWMRQHVFLEVRYYCAGEFTLCAAERFFSRMKAGVFWGCQLLCSNNYTLFS